MQSVRPSEAQGGGRHTSNYLHVHCVDALLPNARTIMGFAELEIPDKQELDKAVEQNHTDLRGNRRARGRDAVPVLPISETSASLRSGAQRTDEPHAAAGGDGSGSYPVQEGPQAPSLLAATTAPSQGTPRPESSPVLDGTMGGGEPMEADEGTDPEPPGLIPPWEDDEEDDGNAASEDDFLDEGEEDAPFGGEHVIDLTFWNTIPLDAILALECTTAGFVPEGVEHAVATLKGQLARQIQQRKRARDEEWGNAGLEGVVGA